MGLPASMEQSPTEAAAQLSSAWGFVYSAERDVALVANMEVKHLWK